MQSGRRVVYALDQSGRSLYCNSPACVHTLMTMGWKLVDPQQLVVLVRQLAAGSPRPGHEPADHLL
jgi:hypothetical protein